MTKKGQVGNIQGFILSIVSVAVVLAVGLIVLDQLQGSTITGEVFNSSHYCLSGTTNATGCATGTMTALPTSYTSTGSIVDELAGVPTWIGIIIVVALAMVVLAYFFSKR